ncbi:hypothetical protein RLF27_02400, partial [Streptococcus pneumoniae]|nr:hypothetical protein [Streptococcus pneumoniae]
VCHKVWQRLLERAPPARRIASCARSLYVVTGLAGEVILVRLKKHFRGGRSLLKAGFAPDLVRREAPRLIAHHEEYREADKSDFALQGCSGMKFEVGEPEAIVT